MESLLLLTNNNEARSTAHRDEEVINMVGPKICKRGQAVKKSSGSWTYLICYALLVLIFVTRTYGSADHTRSDKNSGSNDAVDDTGCPNNSQCLRIKGRRSTFLWSITSPHTNVTSYLFGTVHRPNLWNNVSAQAKQAFNQSDVIALEIDLCDKANFDALYSCSSGTTMGTFEYTNVSEKTEAINEAGLLCFSLENSEIKDSYESTNGTNRTEEALPLDLLLSLKAKLDRKPVISVEKAEEQCEYVQTMTE
uniref:Metalloprotease TIKI homolog n=1 Tax=Acrobeloides nanus TaxID=290746 RepID=A0A914CVM3_9BILA